MTKDLSPLGILNVVVGFPARVVVITRKDGQVFRFAESDEAITISGDSFSVMPGLQISAIKHTSNGEMPSCEIAAIHGAGLTFDTADIDAGLFDAATVQIYTVDRMNLSAKGLLFTGSIATIAYDVESSVTFEIKGPSQFARVLMTRKRSPMCETDLFSTLCGLDPSSYDVATSVDEMTTGGLNFTVTGSLAQADGYFNQGTVVAPNGKAFVIANWVQSTQTITTYLPCSQILSDGDSITLYPGCDKTLGPGGCPKFSNQLNFQGEPHFFGTAAAAAQVGGGSGGGGPTGV